jgi:hypothetical protein
LPSRDPGRYKRRPALQGQWASRRLGGLEIDVKRTLTLAFGHFGWRSLAAEARRERRSLEELLSAAAAFFHSELGTGRSALHVPPPARQPQGRGSGIELALAGLQLALPAAIWQELGAEAARQRVALGPLLEHAALYYLAAADSAPEAARLTDAHGHRGAHPTLKLTRPRPGAHCRLRR